MLNALSIDVEEYFQVHAFQPVIRREEWDRLPGRVVESTRRVLRLLAARDVRATFFVLGWVADRYPHLVQEIAWAGHEIGTHGYWHQLIYTQTPQEFARDLEQSLQALARAVPGVTIRGYRAPAFSITRDSLWALDVLQAYGLQYDSSIFPLSAHDRYGIPNADRFASRVRPNLWEFPVSTLRLGRTNVPVAGGGYFRLYPLLVTRQAIRRLNRQGQPAVVYLHPWEFDPGQPRVREASRLSRFRHYVNLSRTEERLRRLLGELKFGPMYEVFGAQLGVSQRQHLADRLVS